MGEETSDGKSSLMTVFESSTVSQTGISASSRGKSTEDIELSLTDFSFSEVHDASQPPAGEAISSISACGSSPKQERQPRPLFTLLPSPSRPHTGSETSQATTSVKANTVLTKTSGEDFCASILLACLFCHPLDCLWATMKGCNSCLWSICSSLCGCKPTTLQPVLDLSTCEICRCLDVHCQLCDCSGCDICLPFAACLDLAMEISQMLYH